MYPLAFLFNTDVLQEEQPHFTDRMGEGTGGGIDDGTGGDGLVGVLGPVGPVAPPPHFLV